MWSGSVLLENSAARHLGAETTLRPAAEQRPNFLFLPSSTEASFRPRGQHCRVNTLVFASAHILNRRSNNDATGQAAFSLLLLSLHIRAARPQRPAGCSRNALYISTSPTCTHTRARSCWFVYISMFYYFSFVTEVSVEMIEYISGDFKVFQFVN